MPATNPGQITISVFPETRIDAKWGRGWCQRKNLFISCTLAYLLFLGSVNVMLSCISGFQPEEWTFVSGHFSLQQRLWFVVSSHLSNCFANILWSLPAVIQSGLPAVDFGYIFPVSSSFQFQERIEEKIGIAFLSCTNLPFNAAGCLNSSSFRLPPLWEEETRSFCWVGTVLLFTLSSNLKSIQNAGGHHLWRALGLLIFIHEPNHRGCSFFYR